MKIKLEGKSLNELCKEYGTGGNGFYSNNWWKGESFADEKFDAGEYEIDFGENLVDLTFTEQNKRVKKGFNVAHPALISGAILSHYKKTGVRLLENNDVRTSSLDSDGDRVYVGRFDAEGLGVHVYWVDSADDGVGLASVRKLPWKTQNLETFESLDLKSALKIVKAEGYVVYKQM